MAQREILRCAQDDMQGAVLKLTPVGLTLPLREIVHYPQKQLLRLRADPAEFAV